MVMRNFSPEKACGKPLSCPKLRVPPIRQAEQMYVVLFIETGSFSAEFKKSKMLEM